MPKNRVLSTPVQVSFLIGILLACSPPDTIIVPIALLAPSPTAIAASRPKQPKLPYSYDESGLRITILEVVPATPKHGVLVPKGYRQWTVNFRYENLLNTDWEAPNKGRVGHCAGLTSFKLKTDQGNIYKPRFVGGSPFCFRLKPKATSTQIELYIFEIREDEIPTELWGYDVIPRSGEKLLYIFRLAQ